MAPSVLVGDVLYFHAFKNIIEYQLRTPHLSSSKLSTMSDGRLMVAENGRLGFASVDHTSLTLWSREITTEGEERWVRCPVINLKKLIPDGALVVTQLEYSYWCRNARVAGVAEGADIIFVGTDYRVYMVQPKSGRIGNVLDRSRTVFPYMNFYIPAMEAASVAEGSTGGVLNL